MQRVGGHRPRRLHAARQVDADELQVPADVGVSLVEGGGLTERHGTYCYTVAGRDVGDACSDVGDGSGRLVADYERQVDALVHQPYGAHPSYAQGYYDRDNQFYLQWDVVSRDEESTLSWLGKWVYGVDDWTDYLAKLESEQPDIWERLAPGEALAQPVNYGMYANHQGHEAHAVEG